MSRFWLVEIRDGERLIGSWYVTPDEAQARKSEARGHAVTELVSVGASQLRIGEQLALTGRLLNDTTAELKKTQEREALLARLGDRLQDDLGQREAALGRALAIAHRLWPYQTDNGPLWMTEDGVALREWPDVVRWVADAEPLLTLRASLERALNLTPGFDASLTYGPVVGPALNALIEAVREEGGQDDRPGATAQEPSTADEAGAAPAARPAEPGPVDDAGCTCGAKWTGYPHHYLGCPSRDRP